MKGVSGIFIDITILIISYLIIKKYNDNKFKLDFIDMKKNKTTGKHILMGLGLGLVMFSAYKLILFIMGIEIYKGTGFKFYTVNEVLISVATAFVMAAFAGICEEVFCRGVIFNYLSKYVSETCGLITSSVIFTLLYIPQYENFIQLCEILILGFALGYCYVLTKSLYMPIALHFAWNLYNSLTSVNGLALFVYSLNKNLSLEYCNYVIMVAQSIIEVIVASILIFIDIKRKQNSKIENYIDD